MLATAVPTDGVSGKNCGKFPDLRQFRVDQPIQTPESAEASVPKGIYRIWTWPRYNRIWLYL